MKYRDFLSAVHKRCKCKNERITHSDVVDIVDAVVTEIQEVYINAGFLRIPGIGTFENYINRRENFRNPRTGALTKASDKIRPRMIASGKLIRLVNDMYVGNRKGENDGEEVL